MEMVVWVSRHELSPAQIAAIRALHGEGVEIAWDSSTVFKGDDGLADYIRIHAPNYVFAVASTVQCLTAALAGLRFGIFVNDPRKRQDGSFSLAAVYRVAGGTIRRAWVNPNPASDEGESLAPITR